MQEEQIKILSQDEIAERLGIKVSTIRKYALAIEKYLGAECFPRNPQGQRWFTDNNIVLLEQLIYWKEKGYTVDLSAMKVSEQAKKQSGEGYNSKMQPHPTSETNLPSVQSKEQNQNLAFQQEMVQAFREMAAGFVQSQEETNRMIKELERQVQHSNQSNAKVEQRMYEIDRDFSSHLEIQKNYITKAEYDKREAEHELQEMKRKAYELKQENDRLKEEAEQREKEELEKGSSFWKNLFNRN